MARQPPDRARRRLRLGLGIFFVALALPSGALVYRAYDQLKWESFRGQQLAAEELARRIDRRLTELARAEDARPASDYGFLVGGARPAGARRSSLAQFPLSAEIPGLVGWFQVAEDGRFSTPLVPEGVDSPADFGVGPAELAGRQALAARIEGVLIGNRLVERGPPVQVRDEVQTAAPRSIPPARPGGAGQEARYDASENLAPPRPEPAPAPVQAGVRKQASAQAPAPGPVEGLPPRERLSQSAFDRLSAQRAADPSKLGSKREALASKDDRSSSSRKTLAKSELDLAPPPVQGLGRVEELALDAGLAERSPASMEAQIAAGSEPLADSEAPAPAAAPPAVASVMAPAAPKSQAKALGERLAKDKGEVQAKPEAGEGRRPDQGGGLRGDRRSLR